MNTNLYTALITPFENNQIDLEGFKQNLQFQVECEVKGLLVLGTTSESPTLTSDEKEILLKHVCQIASPQMDIMVGTGTNCTSQTIENTHLAEHYKASSALIITPYYNRPTQRGIYKHFCAIAQNTSLPIILYNHPGRSGQNIEIETFIELIKLPNIIGIKDASGNLDYIQKLINACKLSRPNFLVYAGNDSHALPYVALGGHGLISVASNLIPQTMVNMLSTMVEHNFAASQKYSQMLLPLFEALNLEINPTPIKEAMNYCSKSAGDVRLPLTEMEEKNKLILHNTINNTPMIHGEAQPKYYKTSV